MMVWQRHHEEDKPLRFKRIYVEITNVCNLSCPFCPPTGRARRFMICLLYTSFLQDEPRKPQQPEVPAPGAEGKGPGGEL